MLPSFRLIVAAFLCGFIAIFAGLRLAASLHNVRQALPAMTAQAAPLSIAVVAPARLAPVLFDQRFVAGAIPIVPTPAGLPLQALERPPAAPATPATEDGADRKAGPVAAIDPQAATGAASAKPQAALPVDSMATVPAPTDPDATVAAAPASAASDPEIPDLDPGPPAAAVVPAREPPAAKPAPRAKDKSARKKRAGSARRAATRNSFNGLGAPFGHWPQ
jgi:hypothetical protein